MHDVTRAHRSYFCFPARCHSSLLQNCTFRKTCTPCAVSAPLGRTSCTRCRSQPLPFTEPGLPTGTVGKNGEAEGTSTTGYQPQCTNPEVPLAQQEIWRRLRVNCCQRGCNVCSDRRSNHRRRSNVLCRGHWCWGARNVLGVQHNTTSARDRVLHTGASAAYAAGASAMYSTTECWVHSWRMRHTVRMATEDASCMCICSQVLMTNLQ